MKLIRNDKDSQRANNSGTYQRLIEARLDSLSAKRRVKNLACHVEWQKQENEFCDKDVQEQMMMASFAASIEKLRSSIESALNFYSEDSLQMELMKRNNANRDMRVELTRITNEIQQKKKELEAELEEKKRIKQAEIERLKQEEERKKLVAEEKIRKTVRYQSPVQTPDLSMGNFRSVSFVNISPESTLRQNFPGDGALSPNDDRCTKETKSVQGKFKGSILPSFSQLARGW